MTSSEDDSDDYYDACDDDDDELAFAGRIGLRSRDGTLVNSDRGGSPSVSISSIPDLITSHSPQCSEVEKEKPSPTLKKGPPTPKQKNIVKQKKSSVRLKETDQLSKELEHFAGENNEELRRPTQDELPPPDTETDTRTPTPPTTQDDTDTTSDDTPSNGAQFRKPDKPAPKTPSWRTPKRPQRIGLPPKVSLKMCAQDYAMVSLPLRPDSITSRSSLPPSPSPSSSHPQRHSDSTLSPPPTNHPLADLYKDRSQNQHFGDSDSGSSFSTLSTESSVRSSKSKKSSRSASWRFLGGGRRNRKKFGSQEDLRSIDGEHEVIPADKGIYKVKTYSKHHCPGIAQHLHFLQELDHNGAVWCIKFSPCAKLLAIAGEGENFPIGIWVLKSAQNFFNEMSSKYEPGKSKGDHKIDDSPSPPPVPLPLDSPSSETMEPFRDGYGCSVFDTKPLVTLLGHTNKVLDISWSKNYFLLSSSMDKTVRLWHVSKSENLCCFQHFDFVTAIAFHPKDDRYFLSGSMDGKLRLWNIPNKKVALWNEVDGRRFITAVAFCHGGKWAAAGTYDGRCLFYDTEQLKYSTQIRLTKKKSSCKVTGIEASPSDPLKLMVSANDSRIRIFDLRDLTLICKYKGISNREYQIKASFSQDGSYIISGSEDQFVYLWKTQYDSGMLTTTRKDINKFFEAFKAHSATTTVTQFCPNPISVFAEAKLVQPMSPHMVIVTADSSGVVKIFANSIPSPSLPAESPSSSTQQSLS